MSEEQEIMVIQKGVDGSLEIAIGQNGFQASDVPKLVEGIEAFFSMKIVNPMSTPEKEAELKNAEEAFRSTVLYDDE